MSGSLTASYGEAVAAALRDRYGERRCAAKLIARLAGGTERAAQNWLGGQCGPQVRALLLLMAREPAVHEVVLDLVAQQRALDDALAVRRGRRAAA